MKFKNGDKVVAKNYKKRLFKGKILIVVDERKRKLKGDFWIKVKDDEGKVFEVPTHFLRNIKVNRKRKK